MFKTYHHLTRDQRCQIYALKQRGLTQTNIAIDIGVSQVMTFFLIARVETLLRDKQWSPEQICGALHLDDGTKVSHESLYRHIWADKRSGGTFYLHLRQRGKSAINAVPQRRGGA